MHRLFSPPAALPAPGPLSRPLLARDGTGAGALTGITQLLGVALCAFVLSSSTVVLASLANSTTSLVKSTALGTQKALASTAAMEEADPRGHSTVGRDPWTHPLSFTSAVTRPFEPPVDEPYGPGHRGVDLAGSAGDVVRAAGDGIVVHAGMLVDRKVISIQHRDEIRTTYEPVEPTVDRGQHVTRGQAIGRLVHGHPECEAETAVCLHWGARAGDEYFDPLRLLNTEQVRLLPW